MSDVSHARKPNEGREVGGSETIDVKRIEGHK
jgi:hypothetical protein